MSISLIPREPNGNLLIEREDGLILLLIGDCFIQSDKEGTIVYGTSYHDGWCSDQQVSPFNIARCVIPISDGRSQQMRTKRLARELLKNRYGMALTAPNINKAYNYMSRQLTAQCNLNPTPLDELEQIFNFYADWIKDRPKKPRKVVR